MRHANRDIDHLNTLRQYFAQNRRIPSYQRIADLLGFASRGASSNTHWRKLLCKPGSQRWPST